MDFVLIVQMISAALIAVLIYTIIGFIPGTDETSVLMPISLTVILIGTPPVVVLTFFISSIITLILTNAIPTALVGLLGGVMSTPMIEHTLYLKNQGRAVISIKKLVVGSLIGVIVSIPVALVLANILAPYTKNIQSIAPYLFVGGAIFLSLLGKNKILSIISIIPLAILFMSLRHLYWGLKIVPENKMITTSFFLGITIGPLIVSLISLLNKNHLDEISTNEYNEITVPSDKNVKKTINPFKILTKEEIRNASLISLIVNILFVLSPVGLTILFGEAISKRIKDRNQKSFMAITTMSALGQATYLSGIIIPLIALGIPLSPVAIGPGSALFNAPPVFTLDNNLHHILSKSEFIIAILVGAIIACGITYFLINRYASSISTFVLRKIPHEAILGLFIALVLLLSFIDAGLINVFGVLLIGIVCGTLNKLGVNYGIQFMILYASPWLVEQLSLI